MTTYRRGRSVPIARVLTVIVTVLVTVIVGLASQAGPARAHASLDSSSPAAFAVLEQSPTELRLNFSEAPQSGLSSLRLVDADSRNRPVGPIAAVPGDPRSIAAPVEPLPDGLYVVVWSVVSTDGHRVSGSFAFSVGVSSVEAARDLLAQVAAAGDDVDPILDVVVGAVRVLGFVGLALLLGGAWLRHGTGAGRHAPSRLDHMVWVGWAWAVTATVALLPLQAAQVTGGTLRGSLDLERWGTLLEARQGTALVVRLALLAVAAWLVARGPHGTGRRSWHPTAVLVGYGLALTHTVAGHAATADPQPVVIAVTAVHLSAVAAWMGVVGGVGLGARQWDGGPGAALATAAPLARTAAPVAVVTGMAATLLIGPPLDELTATTWGRWLLVKAALVVVIVVVGATAARVTRRTAAGWRPRLLMAEMVLAVATFGAAAGLVSTPPTVVVSVEPVTATLVQGGVLAEVTITPARVGVNELHLIMSPPGGSLQPIGRVTARLEVVGGEVPPFAVDVAVAGVNHWTAPVQFPYPGRWSLEFVAEVRPLEFVQYRTEFEVTG